MAKKLPKKPFDITKHVFFDKCVSDSFINQKAGVLVVHSEKSNTLGFSKGDIIAMALAVGVTGSDL